VHSEVLEVHNAGTLRVLYSTMKPVEAGRPVEAQKVLLTSELVRGAAELVELYDLRWQVETCQADYTSSRRWVSARRIGYHRRDGVARTGRVVPATPGRSHRRSRMSDTTRRPAPPRA
jgi:hypothetical protein